MRREELPKVGPKRQTRPGRRQCAVWLWATARRASAASVFLLLGYPLADPRSWNTFIALLVLVGSGRLLRDASRVLLQLPPPGFDVPVVMEALRDLPDVLNVHDLHVWTLDGTSSIVTEHIVVAAGADMEAVRAAATDVLQTDYQVDQVTMQVERSTLPCREVDSVT